MLDIWAIPHLFERLFVICWGNKRDCKITMPLSLKTMEVQIKGDQWDKRFRTVQVYWDIFYTVVDFGCLLSHFFFFFGICCPPGAFEKNSLCKFWGQTVFYWESKIEHELASADHSLLSISVYSSGSSCSKADAWAPTRGLILIRIFFFFCLKTSSRINFPTICRA